MCRNLSGISQAPWGPRPYHGGHCEVSVVLLWKGRVEKPRKAVSGEETLKTELGIVTEKKKKGRRRSGRSSKQRA